MPTSRDAAINALKPYDASTVVHRITNKIVQTSFDNTGGTSGSPISKIRGEVVAIHFGDAGGNDGSLDVAFRVDELWDLIVSLDFDAGAASKSFIGLK